VQVADDSRGREGKFNDPLRSRTSHPDPEV
jgi:hypothetical protein